MAVFALVHGAWHGAWCFDRLVPALEAKGHRAVAFDLPGHGADPTPPGQVTLDDYVARVGEVLARQPEPAHLLGHSMGGVVITQAGERHAQHVRSLVYLAAFLPRQGESLGSVAMPSAVTPHLRPDREARVVHFDPAGARDAFYLDCADADVAAASARLSPQPIAPWAQAVQVGARYAALPRHYVECTFDKAIPLAEQRRMHGATPCRVHTLDAAHSPFYSMPERLAGVLDRIARES
ncbi:MAG TPA: alpha/beta fold hydrolase [Myxococcota bacterium]|nr:alpha/beta fold hydrolase [Myxococcota bacterium]